MSTGDVPHEGDLDAPALEGLFTKELTSAFAALGCFNLAVFGATGAGKSTLVNAIFGKDVADTGVGQPVTKGIEYHRRDDGFLGIFDSEGFETGSAGDQILDGLRSVVQSRRSGPIDQQIHAAWYVVRWSDRRFEDAQAAFVKALAEMGLPVIVVMTQVPSKDGEVHPHARELADYITGLHLPIRAGGSPVLTNAMADDFTHAPAFGLDRLLDATYDVVPEAAQAALTAAQRLDMERKKKAVKAIINQAATVASGIGAVPIPFTDAALLVPNQVTMIARISAAYGLPPQRSRAMAIAGSLVLTGGATMAGRYAVTNLLKFIPGGAIAGSAISATVAGSLTRAVGIAWARVCEYALSLPAGQQEAFWNSSAVVDRFRAGLSNKR
ncbi:MAG: YcjF family protein [Candidatus Nanopelagicales bacterium]